MSDNAGSRLKQAIHKSLLGGILVVAPFVILGYLFDWLFTSVRGLIRPLTQLLITHLSAPDIVIDAIVIGLIFLACFIIGTFTSTQIGKIWHNKVDRHAEKIAPGYRIIRDIIGQLFGSNKNSPFRSGSVAMAQIYGASIPTKVIGFIADELDNGWFSVFVPTGPNPTSGFIYLLPPDLVQRRPDINTDTAFRIILSAGSGASVIPFDPLSA